MEQGSSLQSSRNDSSASWGSDWDVKRELSQLPSSESLPSHDSGTMLNSATDKEALGYPSHPHSVGGHARVNVEGGAPYFGQYPAKIPFLMPPARPPNNHYRRVRSAIYLFALVLLVVVLSKGIWRGYFYTKLEAGSDKYSQILPPGLVVDRVVMVKTHKTGASTVGNLFYRWAAFHGKKVRCETGDVGELCQKGGLKHTKMRPNFLGDRKEKSLHRSDVFYTANLLIKILSEDGLATPISERSWKTVESDFASVVGLDHIDSMTRLKEQVGVVTILRHPISHYLSYYSYYIEPDNSRNSLKGYMKDLNRVTNPLASEFGIYNESDLLNFLKQTNELRHFSVILLLDRLEESLTVMKILFNWDVKDVIYGHAMNAATLSERITDGKPVSPPPQFQDLDSATRQAIMDSLNLDFVLYERADALLDSQISYLRTIVDWDQELSELRKWVDMLKFSCRLSESHAEPKGDCADCTVKCSTLCTYFGYANAEAIWGDNNGFVEVPENINWDDIQRNVQKSELFC